MIAVYTLIAALILIPVAQFVMGRIDDHRSRKAAERAYAETIERDLTILHHLHLANRIEARRQVELARTIAALNAEIA